MGSIIGWGIIYFVVAFFMSWWPFNAGNDILPFSKYEDVSVNTENLTRANILLFCAHPVAGKSTFLPKESLTL